jgi:hypothetical protein
VAILALLEVSARLAGIAPRAREPIRFVNEESGSHPELPLGTLRRAPRAASR